MRGPWPSNQTSKSSTIQFLWGCWPPAKPQKIKKFNFCGVAGRQPNPKSSKAQFLELLDVLFLTVNEKFKCKTSYLNFWGLLGGMIFHFLTQLQRLKRSKRSALKPKPDGPSPLKKATSAAKAAKLQSAEVAPLLNAPEEPSEQGNGAKEQLVSPAKPTKAPRQAAQQPHGWGQEDELQSQSFGRKPCLSEPAKNGSLLPQVVWPPPLRKATLISLKPSWPTSATSSPGLLDLPVLVNVCMFILHDPQLGKRLVLVFSFRQSLHCSLRRNCCSQAWRPSILQRLLQSTTLPFQ